MTALILLLCGGIAFDQVIKLLVVRYLTYDLVLAPILNFSLVWNKGISWGMLNFEHPMMHNMVTGVIIFVTGLFLFYTLLEYRKRQSVVAETLVLVGAISNIIDRFVYGAVVDFIEFHLGSWYWPTFNVADVFIVMGVIGIFFKHWRGEGNVCKN